jgi:hypothetical protein
LDVVVGFKVVGEEGEVVEAEVGMVGAPVVGGVGG